jgi:hypothetical protein
VSDAQQILKKSAQSQARLLCRQAEQPDSKFENAEAAATHLRSVMLVLLPTQYFSNDKVMSHHHCAGRHPVLFLLCTASVGTIRVRPSSVLPALTKSASKTLTGILETHGRSPLTQC